jgi:hypothetical protein
MTQTEKIHNHLKKGSITPLVALNKYGCFRLAARISELKDQGLDIETRIVRRKKKHFASYILKP